MVYKTSIYPRLSELGSALTATSIQTLKNDFITNSFNTGNGDICPSTLPHYDFDATDYLAANPSLGSATNAITHYSTTGITNNLPVKGGITITPLATPVIITKPPVTEAVLDTVSGLCPLTSCQDIDTLFTLVEQHNNNPEMPGTIMRVKRAVTVSSNQCDIEGEINYDSTIPDIIGSTHPLIQKGGVTYTTVNGSLTETTKSMPYTGVQNITLALYVSVDKLTCEISLSDISGINSGTNIQPNTPLLYKPLIYANEFARRYGAIIGSTTDSIVGNITSTTGSANTTIANYRKNTYAAIGNILNLAGCPSITCATPAVQDQIKSYYATNSNGFTIGTVINVGTLNDSTCDMTFTTTSGLTIAKRFTMAPGPSCTFSVSTMKDIAATPTKASLKDLGNKPNTAAIGISAFTDYSAKAVDPAPLKARAFGLDRARNSKGEYSDAYKTLQFKTPLKQEAALEKEEVVIPAYKFIRFRPLQTRTPDSPHVHVGKFTFFHDKEAIGFNKGSVTNPMGTWEGTIQDVTGGGTTPGWIDRHKKSLVFALPAAVTVNGYSITTAEHGTDPGCDPVSWALEGSTNGTFWTTLDKRMNYSTPVQRSTDTWVERF